MFVHDKSKDTPLMNGPIRSDRQTQTQTGIQVDSRKQKSKLLRWLLTSNSVFHCPGFLALGGAEGANER